MGEWAKQWWGEAPERPSDFRGGTARSSRRRDATPIRSPSRLPAQSTTLLGTKDLLAGSRRTVAKANRGLASVSNRCHTLGRGSASQSAKHTLCLAKFKFFVNGSRFFESLAPPKSLSPKPAASESPFPARSPSLRHNPRPHAWPPLSPDHS